ncbi:unnamed protein product [Sympodiomycopsis kandeliae]
MPRLLMDYWRLCVSLEALRGFYWCAFVSTRQSSSRCPPNYYTEVSTSWALIHSSSTTKGAKNRLIGDYPDNLARDEWALLKASLSMLLFPLSASASVNIHAVRPQAAHHLAWASYGQPDPGDPTLLRLSGHPDLRSLISAGTLLDIYLVLSGDIEAVHPVHPKDLIAPFRASAQREEFAAGIKTWLLGVALLTGQSLDEDDAVDFYGRMKTGQGGDRQSAHLVHATRSPEWQRTGVIGREFCGHPTLSHPPYALGHGSNGLVMRMTEHGDFDSKRWAIMPFPNAGFSSPDQARSSMNVWQGVSIYRKGRKTATLQPASNHRIHVLESLTEGSCPEQVSVPTRA